MHEYQTKKFPGMGQFDPINSTYRSEILLLNGHRLDGYSKSKLYPEPQDKTVMLEKWILRLYKKGYFDKMHRIDFYHKSFSGQDELVFTLYPREYTMQSHTKHVLDKRLIQFLTTLYIQVNKGELDISVLTHKAKRQNEQEIFSLDYKRFKTEQELLEFILKRKDEGHPDGLVMGFFHKYKQRYLVA